MFFFFKINYIALKILSILKILSNSKIVNLIVKIVLKIFHVRHALIF